LSTRLELASGNVRRSVWTKPRTLEVSSGVAIPFQLALNERGEAIVVWSKPRGDRLRGDDGVWVETRSTRGRWSNPRRELPPVHDRDRSSYWQLAFNDRGEAILGWDEYESDNSFRLVVAVRHPHKHFLPPQEIGDNPYFGYALAVARNDEALAIWASYRCCLYAAATPPGGRTFASAQTLASGISMATDPTVAFDAHGDPLAMWARTSDNNHLLIHAATHPSGRHRRRQLQARGVQRSSRPRARAGRAPRSCRLACPTGSPDLHRLLGGGGNGRQSMNPERLVACQRTRERCNVASVPSFFGAARCLIVGFVAVLAVLAIAPSGRPLATSSEIYSVKPDGSDRVDLSNSAGNDSFPVESPRGGRIAFVSDRDGYDAIYVMNDDGSDQRRLAGEITEAHGTICRFSSPVWSPNASTIAFSASCLLGGDPRNVLTLLNVVPSTGGSVQELDTGASDPSFSADGRFLAFRQQSNSISATTVGFVALNGGLPVSLGAGSGPAWSPTGHRLAFQSGTRGITVVDVTRPSHRWTFPTRNAGAPSWSPRGDLIAFYRGGARPGIYVVRAGKRPAARIVDLGEAVAVRWSPNARWLALNGDVSAYLVGRGGRSLKRIGGAASAAAWSPNSAHIAWADLSLDGVAVTNPRTQRTVLVASSTALYGVTWTRDSQRVIFSSACGPCAS